MVVKGNKVISEGMKEKRERKKDEGEEEDEGEGSDVLVSSLIINYTKTTLGKEGERREERRKKETGLGRKGTKGEREE